jgi:CubicO group peptidase (beta-lactamase class C family)
MGVRALVVLTDGQPVLSWGDVATPYRVASVRKSFLSALFGIAVQQRSIDLDSSLAKLGIDDHRALTEAEKTATVRQLLQSRSGIYLPAAGESAAADASRPARGSHAPGTHWWYNNWDFNVLGEIYQRLTNQGLFTAMEHLLFRPLGFQDLDPATHLRLIYTANAPRFPMYDMLLSARDMARFGQMYLEGGRYAGRQLVPAPWVAESTRAHSLTGHPDGALFSGYGYMWWVTAKAAWENGAPVPAPSFAAAGIGGRFIAVLPTLRTVLATQPFTEPVPMPRGIAQQGALSKLVAQLVAASATGGLRSDSTGTG